MYHTVVVRHLHSIGVPTQRRLTEGKWFEMARIRRPIHSTLVPLTESLMSHIPKLGTMLATGLVVIALGACQDAQMPTEVDAGLTPDAATMLLGQQDDPFAAGRTIQNITATLEDGTEFVGRIVDLTFEVVDGDLLATGRLIGSLNGDRINELFEGVNLGPILDLLDPGADACQILFLELGPIFLDVLGLVVEVPDPLIVEIRAEPGPGALLGNLLCALVGILD